MSSVEHIPIRIFLIGPMGAGKTTIGMSLAKSLTKKFYDCDKEIELARGESISQIFGEKGGGEADFREYEASMLAELAQLDDIVLATGGGIVLLPENRQLLKERGFVVYLTASLDVLCQRIDGDENRPLRDNIAQLLVERTPLYEEVVDLTVDTGSKSVEKVVALITETIGMR